MHSLRIGIFGAEPWTNDMRVAIEQRMGIDAVDIYGLSEVIAPASRPNASRPRTARPSGKTTSIRKSSIPKPFGGGQTEKQVQLIQDFRPDIIMVTPSYMLSIADEIERQGLDPVQSSLRIGIFGAEPWTNDMRVAIEQRMGIDAVDIYGLSEVMGPGVASECVETKDGPTIWEDHFYPEIIDPETGEVLPDGELGGSCSRR